jgi:hypothetical protein
MEAFACLPGGSKMETTDGPRLRSLTALAAIVANDQRAEPKGLKAKTLGSPPPEIR